jgi:hypothetical protein
VSLWLGGDCQDSKDAGPSFLAYASRQVQKRNFLNSFSQILFVLVFACLFFVF